MGKVNLKQARARLSELVRAAERGESVTITRRGKEVARIVPVSEEPVLPLPDLSELRASIASCPSRERSTSWRRTGSHSSQRRCGPWMPFTLRRHSPLGCVF